MSNWFVEVIDEFWPCQNGLRIKLSDPETIEVKLEEWVQESEYDKWTLHLNEIIYDLANNPNISWNYYVVRQQNNNSGFQTYELRRSNFEIRRTISRCPEASFSAATNPNTTIEVFETNKDIIWNIPGLSENPNFGWDFYRKYEDDFWSWDYAYMSQNPNITGKIVRANPDKKWEYMWLSTNPSITWEDVLLEPYKPWDYIECLRTKYINIKNILTNSEHAHERMLRLMSAWSNTLLYSYLSSNPYITWQVICDYPDKPWNYGYMSNNPNITGEIVEANLDKPWNYRLLSGNPGIKWEYIRAHPELDWDYSKVLRFNPSLSAADARDAIKYVMSKDNNVNPLAEFAKNKLGFHPYFRSQAYQQPLAKRRHDQMYSELLASACRTSRVFSWNEGAAEQMPEQYAAECRRWRDMKFKSQAQQQQQE
jgi:hypothetical protein